MRGYRCPSDGKARSKTVKSIGYFEDLQKEFSDPITHFKQVAREMTLAEKEQKVPELIRIPANALMTPTTNNLKNLGSAVLSKIYHELDLNVFIKNNFRRFKREFNSDAILKMLVYSRILSPCSKKKTWEERGKYFDKMEFSLDDVYRFLGDFSSLKSKLQLHLHRKIQHETELVYYDVTNYYFEIDESDNLRKKGVSKEHRPNPIVQMGLFMDKSGIPISFDLFPGNTNDCETLVPQIREFNRDFNLGRIVVVADKGLNTTKNIIANILSGDGYVYSQSVRKAGNELKNYVLEEKGYRLATDKEFKVKSRIYPRVIEVKGKKVSIDERQVIFWSADYDKRAKAERAETIAKARKIVNNPGLYANYGSHKYIKNGNGKNLIFDERRLTEDEKFDGYYAIVTSELDKTDKEVIEIYRGLWKIEENFKVTKGDLEARPVYLSKEEHIKAHFMVCFVALVILRLLEQKLQIGVSEIVGSLRNSNCVAITDGTYVSSYFDEVLMSVKQKLDVDLQSQFSSQAQIKKIFAASKI